MLPGPKITEGIPVEQVKSPASQVAGKTEMRPSSPAERRALFNSCTAQRASLVREGGQQVVTFSSAFGKGASSCRSSSSAASGVSLSMRRRSSRRVQHSGTMFTCVPPEIMVTVKSPVPRGEGAF